VRAQLEEVTSALLVNVECGFWSLAKRAARDLGDLLHHRAGGVDAYVSGSGYLLSSTDAAGVSTTYTRDGLGRLTGVTRRGRSYTMGYADTSSRPSQIAGPGGVVLASYRYDSNGRLEAVDYPDGTGYRYGYDASARLLWVANGLGERLETHVYDGQGRAITSEIGDGRDRLSFAFSGNRTTVTDVLGNATVYDWATVKGSYRVTKVTGPCTSCGGGGSATQEWGYDADGNVTSYKDGAGKVWSYTYSPEGDLLTETDPLSRVTSYTYDTQGRVLTKTGPDGATTTYVPGPAGPTSITEQVTPTESRTTAISYNAEGKPQTITDARNKQTSLSYNGTGDLTSVTDPLSHSTSFGYDALGRRTTVTDALGHTTTTAYDARGKVTRITSHDGTHTDFGYDKGGRRTSVTDPLGRTTRYAYDSYGRLSQVVDPLGGATKYGYDLMGSLTSLTDAKNQTTAFEYDAYRRVKKVTYPGGAFESFTYDTAGRLQTKTDRKNVTTTYSYDFLGRLLGKSYSDGATPPVSYSYDTAGRLQTAANGTDTLTWTYDLAGQLLSEQSSKNASTVAYTYDAAGNRLTVSLDGALFVSYGYDDASRLTTITRGANVFAFAYDDANRRTSMSYPNGVTTSYVYDTLNRLLNLQANHVPTSTPITSFTYTYDAAGNRTRKQQLDYTEDYRYDGLYRLTQAERTGGLAGIQTWSYDAVGNRLTNQKDGVVTTSSYNEKNQLLSTAGGGSLLWRGTLDEPGNVSFTSATVNGKPARMLPGNVFEALLPMQPGPNAVTLEARDTSGNVATKTYDINVTGDGASYSYDANGNLTQKVEGADTWAYEWNAENQLTRVTKNSAEQARFAYDPLGRRVEKVGSTTGTSAYAYDGEDIVRLTAGPTVTEYVHGPGIDEPYASEDGAGALSFLTADGLGSLTATTNAAGATTSAVRYDAWGNVEMGSPSPYGFTGREPDAETGFGYYRARYYDPHLGRFISEDPIEFEAEVNFYAYARNSPIRYVDPTGTIIWHVNEDDRQVGGVFPPGSTGIAQPRVEPRCEEVCGKFNLVFHIYATITQRTASPSSGGAWYAAWSQKHENWHRSAQRDNLIAWAASLRPYEHVYDSKEECKAAAKAATSQQGTWDPVKDNMDMDTRFMRWVHGIR
jgi:RHS repeat-associated protein